MNLSREATDRIRRKSEAAHRLARRARLEAMESDAHALKATILEQGRQLATHGDNLMKKGARLALLEGRIHVMQSELRQDETTVRLPVLPADDGETLGLGPC